MDKTIKIEKIVINRYSVRQDEDKYMVERMIQQGKAHLNEHDDYAWFYMARDQKNGWFYEARSQKEALVGLAEVMFG